MIVTQLHMLYVWYSTLKKRYFHSMLFENDLTTKLVKIVLYKKAIFIDIHFLKTMGIVYSVESQ